MRIWTDFDGAIVRASEEAARLFNLSRHNLEQRPIHYFFDGNRQQLFQALDRIARGDPFEAAEDEAEDATAAPATTMPFLRSQYMGVAC